MYYDNYIRKVCFLVFVCFCFFDTMVAGQEPQGRVSRQSAVDAFSRGQYEEAYIQFSGLLTLYPRDPLYRYYAGVCLVNLKRSPAEAAEMLKEASRGSGTVKPVPADVWFWLGRAQQMAGMFGDAIDSYERFTVVAGKKAARELDVPSYIKQCIERRGEAAVNIPSEKQKTAAAEAIPPAKLGKDVVAEPVKEEISKPAVPEIAPEEVDARLSKLLAEKTEGRKPELKESVTKDTGPTAAVRAGADTFSKDNEKPLVTPLPKMQDGAAVVKKTTDTLTVSPAGINFAERRIPVFSHFEITENPGNMIDNKIPLNPDVPSGLIYRIQVAIFRNPVAALYFKGLFPVQGFRSAGSDLTVYYAGMFRRHEDAAAALVKVRAHGFKDAFVVALMDRKQVSIDRARVLEKEWGMIPLYEITQKAAERDTVPPTLVFRVEVMKTSRPLPASQLEEMKKLAGGKGFDILVDDKKECLYLTGVFLNYRSAEEYADLLVRNGYRDARVVAYLGMKEVPVDIARKLFEEY